MDKLKVFEFGRERYGFADAERDSHIFLLQSDKLVVEE